MLNMEDLSLVYALLFVAVAVAITAIVVVIVIFTRRPATLMSNTLVRGTVEAHLKLGSADLTLKKGDYYIVQTPTGEIHVLQVTGKHTSAEVKPETAVQHQLPSGLVVHIPKDHVGVTVKLPTFDSKLLRTEAANIFAHPLAKTAVAQREIIETPEDALHSTLTFRAAFFDEFYWDQSNPDEWHLCYRVGVHSKLPDGGEYYDYAVSATGEIAKRTPLQNYVDATGQSFLEINKVIENCWAVLDNSADTTSMATNLSLPIRAAKLCKTSALVQFVPAADDSTGLLKTTSETAVQGADHVVLVPLDVNGNPFTPANAAEIVWHPGAAGVRFEVAKKVRKLF